MAKSLDQLISEEMYQVVLEDRYTRDQAIKILANFGIKDAGSFSPENLKILYRKMAQKYHPDVGGDHNQFIKLASAIEALKTYPAGSERQSRPQPQPQPQQPKPQQQSHSSSNYAYQSSNASGRSYTLPNCPKCKAPTNSIGNYCTRCGNPVRVNY